MQNMATSFDEGDRRLGGGIAGMCGGWLWYLCSAARIAKISNDNAIGNIQILETNDALVSHVAE